VTRRASAVGAGVVASVGVRREPGSTLSSRAAAEEDRVEIWQIVAFAFVALLPLALTADFWPHRERLDLRGRPVAREWERQLHPTVPGEDEHH
jgi:hypothetical protein